MDFGYTMFVMSVSYPTGNDRSRDQREVKDKDQHLGVISIEMIFKVLTECDH